MSRQIPRSNPGTPRRPRSHPGTPIRTPRSLSTLESDLETPPKRRELSSVSPNILPIDFSPISTVRTASRTISMSPSTSKVMEARLGVFGNVSRRKWTPEQLVIVNRYFGHHVLDGTLPKIDACQDVINQYSVLQNKDATKLYALINNYMRKVHPQGVTSRNSKFLLIFIE